MTDSKTLSHVEEAESELGSSMSGLDSAKGKILELDVLYLRFEERFINNRFVLIILFAVSAVLGILAYIYRDVKDSAAFIVPAVVVIGWGFYKVAAGIIIARSKMRTARKMQEILRTAVADASRSLKP